MAKEWVEKDLGGIETIVKSQVGITGYNTYPFEDIEIKQNYRWEEYNTTKYGTHESLELDNFGFLMGTSGAAHFRVANNWKVQFLVYSENYDYMFDEIMSGEKSKTDDIGNAVGDSFVVFTLQADGYISVDVAGDHTGIANFNVRLDESDFIFKSSSKMNNECQLVVLKTWHYEEVEDPAPTEDELWDEGNDSREEESEKQKEKEQEQEDDDDDDDDDDDTPKDDDKEADFMDYFFLIGAIALVGIAFGLLR